MRSLLEAFPTEPTVVLLDNFESVVDSETQTIKDGELDEALLYNRKLWTIFLASVTQEDNPLPKEVRQNVANLGLFVMNQTIALLAQPRPEQIRPLVSINRELAAGLLGRV